MGKKRRVVVEGGGADLYEIEESSGRYLATHVRVGILANRRESVGSASSLEDALSLIRSFSGRAIKRID